MPSNLERKASRAKRQTRLTFEATDLPNSSSSPGSKLTPARVRYGTRGKDGVFAVRTPPPKIKFAVDSDATLGMQNSDRVGGTLTFWRIGNLDDSDEHPILTRSQRRTTKSSGNDEFEHTLPTQRGMFSASQAVKAGNNGLDSDDTESSDEPTVPPATRKKKPETITIEDSSDELSKSNRTARTTRRTKKSRENDAVVDLSDSDPVITSSAVRKPAEKATVIEDSSEEDIVSPRKRARKDLAESSSESDSDIRASPAKRRHTANAHPTDFAGSAGSSRSSPVHATRKRTQKKRHRTQKEKDLELMKLRRAGNKNAVLSESESSSEEDSNDEQTLDHLSEFEDEEEDVEPEPSNVKASKKSRRKPRSDDENQDDEDDDDEDNFIIEDDDEIGIPSGSEIPLEFTAHYNKPEKEHFRDAVEFFVHKELNPTYAEKQDLFQRAFQKLDSKPTTLRNSEYKSSQWTTEFVTALEARPNYVEVPVSGSEFGEGRCEPCNRSKHPPKFAISFTGKAYDRETLEEIEQDDRDDSDEEDAGSRRRGGSVDGKGRHIAAEDRE
jgi:hypothetical protein